MSHLLVLVPIALGLGFAGLLTFVWCLKSGQFDDLEGSAVRILDDPDSSEDLQLEADQNSNNN